MFYDIIEVSIGKLFLFFIKNEHEENEIVYLELPNGDLRIQDLFDKINLLKQDSCKFVFQNYKKRSIFLDYFNGKKVDFSTIKINIDFFNPTQFQKSVWNVCRKIPLFSTFTYQDISLLLGIKSYRAVGTALGKNKIPLIIPCHRVVSKKDIGGFSGAGGVDMKKRLLSLEN